ncbi:MAG: 3-phosphoserine/phosphohydroxythreonine transaminase [Oscillospiraceae bacterium]|jgi:phosphoserine aminotransferase|nr:3-phosphoserine/phosphohydroxythreonine transaminase [Oscillospiraceae bacterium]
MASGDHKDRIYNFSAGPSILPLSVLETAAAEMTNYRGSGMSVMEMSHRSRTYLAIFDEVKSSLRSALGVPNTHEILFMQGGATFQFSAAPLNLIGENGEADYAVTGNFASVAAKEARKYGRINIAASSEDRDFSYIPAQDALKLSENARYFYYCANNTIYGTEWKYVPETAGVPIVCDMSSNILSKPVDVSKYGVIFAGVQKNMAPAGMAVVIVDKSLAGRELPFTPKIMSYKTAIEKDSMDNTPPCYTIYMLGLVLKWLETQGGVAGMERKKAAKAKLLYDALDSSRLFTGRAEKSARSDMNITFGTNDPTLDEKFVREAAERGLANLAGHRSAGGMRASLYNAMPEEGVLALTGFMRDFEAENIKYK